MSVKRTLLISSDWQVINFISEKRAIKLFFNGKVEIINNWDDFIFWDQGKMHFPATLRLISPFKRNYHKLSFSRQSVIKRDQGICQFCGKKLTPPQITIDHLIPKDLGGQNSFTNCVVACRPCNIKKGNKTLEEAEMTLIRKPIFPNSPLPNTIYLPYGIWHADWDNFNIER